MSDNTPISGQIGQVAWVYDPAADILHVCAGRILSFQLGVFKKAKTRDQRAVPSSIRT